MGLTGAFIVGESGIAGMCSDDGHTDRPGLYRYLAIEGRDRTHYAGSGMVGGHSGRYR